MKKSEAATPGEPPAHDEAAAIHALLTEKLGHRWRYETWRGKYEARLRVYGAEKCRIAVDGFCSMPWYVREQGHNAPDLIFRSDRAFEKFLAVGEKLPAHSDENRAREAEANEKWERVAETRARLERENADLTRRFHEKIGDLDLNALSWGAFIKDLLVVEVKKDEVTLFSENAAWVEEHYIGRIEKALGGKVKVTVVDALPEGSPLLKQDERKEKE